MPVALWIESQKDIGELMVATVAVLTWPLDKSMRRFHEKRKSALEKRIADIGWDSIPVQTRDEIKRLEALIPKGKK